MITNRRITRRRHLLAGAAAMAVAITSPAFAQVLLPTGGTVTVPAPVVPVNPVEWRYGADAFNVGGVITAPVIPPGDPIPTNLNIRIGSTATVIDWQSFSIGAGNTVEFLNNVGGAAFAVLNRVGGVNQSTISGILSGDAAQAAANRGSIWVVNPNGVIFGPQSSVTNMAGFVASSLAVTNTEFTQFATGMYSDAEDGVNFAGSSMSGITLQSTGASGANINVGGVVLLVAPTISVAGGASPAQITGSDVGFVVAQDATVRLDPNSLMRVTIAAGTALDNGQLLAAGTVNGQRIYAAAASQAAVGDILLNITGSMNASHAMATENGIVLRAGRADAAGQVDITMPAMNNLARNIVVSGSLSAAGSRIDVAGNGNVTFEGTQAIPTTRLTLDAANDVALGTISGVTGNIVATAGGTLGVAGLTAGGSISLTATTGNITTSGGTLRSNSSNAIVGARGITLSAASGAVGSGAANVVALVTGSAGTPGSFDAIDVTAGAGSAVTLGNIDASALTINPGTVGNIRLGLVTLTSGLTLDSAGTIDIANLNARGAVDLESTGLLANGVVTVNGINNTIGSVTLRGSSVALGSSGISTETSIAVTANTGNITTSGGTLRSNSSNAIVGARGITLSAASGAVGSGAANVVALVTGSAGTPGSFDATDVTAGAGSAVTLGNIDASALTINPGTVGNIRLGLVTLTSGLTLDSAGTIDIANLNARGAVDLESTGLLANGVVTVNGINNTIGSVTLRGSSVALGSSGISTETSIAVTANTGNITTSGGTLRANSSNAIVGARGITLSAASGAVGSGAANVVALVTGSAGTPGSFDAIDVTAGAGSAVTFGNVTASGFTVNNTAGAIRLGTTNLSGGLTLANASGGITIANLTTGDTIDLNAVGGLLQTGSLDNSAGTVTLRGGSIQVTDTSALTVASATSTAGDIVISASGALGVTGDVASTGGRVSLTGVGVALGNNATASSITASNGVTIAAGAGAITLGTQNVALTANSGNTAAAGRTVSLTAGTGIGAGGGLLSITAGNSQASGLAITVQPGDAAAVTLGAVSGGSLSMVPPGAETIASITTGDVQAFTGGISLNAATITSGSLAARGTIALTSPGALALSTVRAGGGVTIAGAPASVSATSIEANGAIDITTPGALTIANGGALATRAGTLDATTLATFAATGTNVANITVSADSYVLNGVVPTSSQDLSLTRTGAVAFDTSGLTFVAGRVLSLTSATGVTLANSATYTFGTDLVVTGPITTNAGLSLTAGNGAIRFIGATTANDGLTLSARTLELGTVTGAGAAAGISLTATNGNLATGSVSSLAGLILSATGGQIITNGVTSFTAADAGTVGITGAVNVNNGLTVTGAGVTMGNVVTRGTDSGVGAGDVAITATTGNVVAGTVASRGAVGVAADAVGGTVQLGGAASSGGVLVTANANANITGAVSTAAGGTYVVRAGSISVGTLGQDITQSGNGGLLLKSAGAIDAIGNLTLAASDGNLVLDTGGAITGTANLTNLTRAVFVRRGDDAAALRLGNVSAASFGNGMTVAGLLPADYSADGAGLKTGGAITLGQVALTDSAVSINSTLGAIVVGGASSTTGAVSVIADDGNLTVGADAADTGSVASGANAAITLRSVSLTRDTIVRANIAAGTGPVVISGQDVTLGRIGSTVAQAGGSFDVTAQRSIFGLGALTITSPAVTLAAGTVAPQGANRSIAFANSTTIAGAGGLNPLTFTPGVNFTGLGLGAVTARSLTGLPATITGDVDIASLTLTTGAITLANTGRMAVGTAITQMNGSAISLTGGTELVIGQANSAGAMTLSGAPLTLTTSPLVNNAVLARTGQLVSAGAMTLINRGGSDYVVPLPINPGGDLIVISDSISVNNNVTAGGGVLLKATTGGISATGTPTIEAQNGKLVLDSSTSITGRANLKATSNDLLVRAGNGAISLGTVDANRFATAVATAPGLALSDYAPLAANGLEHDNDVSLGVVTVVNDLLIKNTGATSDIVIEGAKSTTGGITIEAARDLKLGTAAADRSFETQTVGKAMRLAAGRSISSEAAAGNTQQLRFFNQSLVLEAGATAPDGTPSIDLARSTISLTGAAQVVANANFTGLRLGNVLADSLDVRVSGALTPGVNGAINTWNLQIANGFTLRSLNGAVTVQTATVTGASQNLTVQAASGLAIGSVKATNDVNLIAGAGQLSLRGVTEAGRDLVLSANGAIVATNQLLAGRDLTADAGATVSLRWTQTNDALKSRAVNDVRITAGSTNEVYQIVAGNNLTLESLGGGGVLIPDATVGNRYVITGGLRARTTTPVGPDVAGLVNTAPPSTLPGFENLPGQPPFLMIPTIPTPGPAPTPPTGIICNAECNFGGGVIEVGNISGTGNLTIVGSSITAGQIGLNQFVRLNTVAGGGDISVGSLRAGVLGAPAAELTVRSGRDLSVAGSSRGGTILMTAVRNLTLGTGVSEPVFSLESNGAAGGVTLEAGRFVDVRTGVRSDNTVTVRGGTDAGATTPPATDVKMANVSAVGAVLIEGRRGVDVGNVASLGTTMTGGSATIRTVVDAAIANGNVKTGTVTARDIIVSANNGRIETGVLTAAQTFEGVTTRGDITLTATRAAGLAVTDASTQGDILVASVANGNSLTGTAGRDLAVTGSINVVGPVLLQAVRNLTTASIGTIGAVTLRAGQIGDAPGAFSGNLNTGDINAGTAAITLRANNGNMVIGTGVDDRLAGGVIVASTSGTGAAGNVTIRGVSRTNGTASGATSLDVSASNAAVLQTNSILTGPVLVQAARNVTTAGIATTGTVTLRAGQIGAMPGSDSGNLNTGDINAGTAAITLRANNGNMVIGTGTDRLAGGVIVAEATGPAGNVTIRGVSRTNGTTSGATSLAVTASNAATLETDSIVTNAATIGANTIVTQAVTAGSIGFTGVASVGTGTLSAGSIDVRATDGTVNVASVSNSGTVLVQARSNTTIGAIDATGAATLRAGQVGVTGAMGTIVGAGNLVQTGAFTALGITALANNGRIATGPLTAARTVGEVTTRGDITLTATRPEGLAVTDASTQGDILVASVVNGNSLTGTAGRDLAVTGSINVVGPVLLQAVRNLSTASIGTIGAVTLRAGQIGDAPGAFSGNLNTGDINAGAGAITLRANNGNMIIGTGTDRLAGGAIVAEATGPAGNVTIRGVSRNGGTTSGATSLALTASNAATLETDSIVTNAATIGANTIGTQAVTAGSIGFTGVASVGTGTLSAGSIDVRATDGTVNVASVSNSGTVLVQARSNTTIGAIGATGAATLRAGQVGATGAEGTIVGTGNLVQTGAFTARDITALANNGSIATGPLIAGLLMEGTLTGGAIGLTATRSGTAEADSTQGDILVASVAQGSSLTGTAGRDLAVTGAINVIGPVVLQAVRNVTTAEIATIGAVTLRAGQIGETTNPGAILAAGDLRTGDINAGTAAITLRANNGNMVIGTGDTDRLAGGVILAEASGTGDTGDTGNVTIRGVSRNGGTASGADSLTVTASNAALATARLLTDSIVTGAATIGANAIVTPAVTAGSIAFTGISSVNTGNLTATSVDVRATDGTVNVASVSNSGTVLVQARSNTTIGAIGATGAATLRAGQVGATGAEGTIVGAGNLVQTGAFTARDITALANNGSIATGPLTAGLLMEGTLTGGAIGLTATRSGTAEADSTQGDISVASIARASGLTATAGRNLDIIGNVVMTGNATLTAAGRIKTADIDLGNGALVGTANGPAISGADSLKTGALTNTTSIDLRATAGTVDVASVSTAGTVLVQASGNTTIGAVGSTGAVTLRAGQIGDTPGAGSGNLRTGTINAGTAAITLRANNGNVVAGTAEADRLAGGAILVSTTGDATLIGVTSASSLGVTAGQDIVSGTIGIAGGVTLNAGRDATLNSTLNAASLAATAGRAATLVGAATLTGAATIGAGSIQTAAVNASSIGFTGASSVNTGTLSAGTTDVRATAGTVTVAGLASTGTVLVQASSNTTITGATTSTGAVTLRAGQIGETPGASSGTLRTGGINATAAAITLRANNGNVVAGTAETDRLAGGAIVASASGTDTLGNVTLRGVSRSGGTSGATSLAVTASNAATLQTDSNVSGAATIGARTIGTAGVTAGSIGFTGTASVATGNLTASTIDARATAGTVNVASVSGSGTVLVQASGNTTIGAVGSTGAVTLRAGQVDGTAGTGSLVAGAITSGTAAITLRATNGNITTGALSGGALLAEATGAAPAGNVTIASANGASLGVTASSTATLQGASTLSGAATIGAAAISTQAVTAASLAFTAATGATTGALTASAGNVDVRATNGTVTIASITGTGTATVQASGNTTVTGATSTTGAVTMRAGQVGATGAAGTITGTGSLMTAAITAAGTSPIDLRANGGSITTGGLTGGAIDGTATGNTGNITVTGLSRATRLTLTSGGTVSFTANMRVTGEASLTANRIDLGSGAELRTDGAILFRANSGTTAVNIANGAGSLFDNEDMPRVFAPSLRIDALNRTVTIGTADLFPGTPTGANAGPAIANVGVTTTGDIDVIGTLTFKTASGTPRTLTLGGDAVADSSANAGLATQARSVAVRVQTPTGAAITGGRIVADGSVVRLNGQFVAVGQATTPAPAQLAAQGGLFGDRVLGTGQAVTADQARGDFTENPGSPFYRAFPAFVPPEYTIVTADKLVVRVQQWGLLQNTGTAAQPGGGVELNNVQLLAATGGPTGGPIIGFFGKLGGQEGIAAALRVSVDQLGGISPNNVRINGCVALTTAGCIVTGLPLPLVQLNDPNQSLLIRNTPDLVLPVELISGTTNEALWRDDEDDDDDKPALPPVPATVGGRP